MTSNKTTNRINFASTKNQLEYPDFLDIQIGAFRDFFQIGASSDRRKEEGLCSKILDYQSKSWGPFKKVFKPDTSEKKNPKFPEIP